MSKFIKTLAVISALAIFCTGFTSCKDDEDNDTTSTTINTGFEGKYFSERTINNSKIIAGENEEPYASCSVEVIIFNKNGTGTYKGMKREYLKDEDQRLSIIKSNFSEDFAYTKSGSTLKFNVSNDDLEFTIKSDDTICYGDRSYDKEDIKEIYAYINIEAIEGEETSKTVTSKAILLRNDNTSFMKNIVSTFESFGRGEDVDNSQVAGTYEKSGTNITFTEKNTGIQTTGSFKTEDEKTYLNYNNLDYIKL